MSSRASILYGVEAIDFLPLLAMLTALAVPTSPTSWCHASKAGRSKIGTLCDVTTIISALLIVYVWAKYPMQESYRAFDLALSSYSSDEGKDQVTAASHGHFGLATIIAGTAFCLELFRVLAHQAAIASSGTSDSDSASVDDFNIGNDIVSSIRDSTSMRRDKNRKFRLWTLSHLNDSECIFLVYTILLSVYGLMFFSSGRYNILYADPYVTNFHRPTNAVRFIEWAIASPILMTLTARSIPRVRGSDLSDLYGDTLSNLIRPGLVVTSMYMWLTFMAQVVLDYNWRIILITVAFLCYIFASLDQCTAWLRDCNLSARTATMAVYLLYFQVVFFGLYGVVFLTGLFGMLDPILEQKTFTVWDVTIKVAFSAALMAMRSATLLDETSKAKSRYATAAHDLSRIFDKANAPIFAVDLELKVTMWNKKLANITGHGTNKVLGMSLSDFLSPDCRQDVMDVLGQCNDDKPTTGQFHCNFLSTSADSGAKKISIIMTGTVRHNVNNDPVGIVGIGQDLTEVTHYRDIEVRKRQLMAMVSHEIKSPLHGIIGLSGTLASTETDDTRSQQLTMVKSCATRLLDLVTNIMDMSVLQSDSKSGDKSNVTEKDGEPLARDPVDIGGIISEVCTLARNAVDKSTRPLLNPDVQLMNHVSSSSLPIVFGEAYKITQVFYNIITNACKFCSSGKIVVSAGVNFAKDKLNVCVEDTGVGIGEEHLKRIFEPFEQEQPAHQRSFGGIGLGLAIAREVMRKHGGDITVRSIVGEGSAFTVSFPVTPENFATVSAPNQTISNSNKNVTDVAPKVSGEQSKIVKRCDDADLRIAMDKNAQKKLDGSGKPVILSVDDDLVNQEVIKSALSEKYEIHTAMDGFEALSYFDSRSKLPDLVLLDVMMPGMTGFEVLDSIRKNNGISPTVLPVIMLSATEPVGKAIIQSLDSGSNDYVPKPFDISILRARVRTAIQIKRLHEVQLEMTQYSQLLHEIMPHHIVSRLISGEQVISERHDSACILFSDIVGWTSIAEEIPTPQLVGLLNNLFSKFDSLTEKHKVFKVETIGDAYIVASGHDNWDGQVNHTHRVVNFGLAMIEAAKSIPMPSGLQLQLRVGIHIGPVYTGVIGHKVPKFTFFGDTVNTSSRMESTGVAGCIQISSETREALEVEEFDESRSMTTEEWLKGKGAMLVERGNIEVKNKGIMKTHIIFPKGVTPTRAVLSPRSSTTCASIESAVSAVKYFDADAEIAAREEAQRAIAKAEKRADEAKQEAKAAFKEMQETEAKLLGELKSLQAELQKIKASERKSREECEKLQLSLAGSQAQLHSNAVGKSDETHQSVRNSFRRMSGRSSSNSSLTSLIHEKNSSLPAVSSEADELRLQLLVTTKALNRAREDLMAKEEEIDMKELELQSLVASQQNSEMITSLSNTNTMLRDSIRSMSYPQRRISFSHRTEVLLQRRSSTEPYE